MHSFAFEQSLDEQNGVQAAVVFGVVGNSAGGCVSLRYTANLSSILNVLSIATPDNLSTGRHKTEFGNVDFDNGTLCQLFSVSIM